MKRIISITFLLTVVIFSSKAQFENIDLSEYKLPEVERHRLDFKFNLRNYFNKDFPEDSPETSSFDLNNDFDVFYYYYLNTEKIQMNGWGNFSSDIDLDWRKNNGDFFDKNDSYHHRLNVGFEKRNYYNGDDKWFLFWSPGFYVYRNRYYNKEKSDYGDNLSDTNFSQGLFVSPEIKIGTGIGRIESVGDLRRTIYILEDLMKNDRLEKIPDEDDIYKLADKVAKLRNQRFFDSRLRRIYEIKSIDSTLNNLGLINDMDAVYFTSLNDMWIYGSEIRQSGTRFQMNIMGDLLYSFNKSKYNDYTYSQEQITRTDEEKVFTERIGSDIVFDSYKPIGLTWERYYSAFLAFNHYFLDRNHINNSTGNYENTFSGGMKYRYKWFMNTRTYASLSAEGRYSYYDYPEEHDFEDFDQINFKLKGNLYYYFSPRLKVSYDLSVNYDWNNNSRYYYEKEIFLINEIGINYTLF